MMSWIVEFGASLFDSLLCVYFITKFNKATFKRNILSAVAFVLILGITLIGDHTSDDFNLLCTVLLFLVSLAYAIAISKKQYFTAFISACIYKILLIFLSTILFYAYSSLFDDFGNLLYGSDEYARYIYIITHKVLLLGTLKLVLFFDNKKNKYESTGNGILTFIFSLISVFGLGILMSISLDPSSTNLKLLFLALIFISLNSLLYVLLFQISHIYHKYHELNMVKQLSEHEESKYHEALQLWQSSEKIRHDVKHHMIAISGFIADGKIDECQAYICEYMDQSLSSNNLGKSGNHVIDYIVDTKLSSVENAEIIVAGNVGTVSDMKDTDLAALIGNILDNAIEAEEKVDNKRIELLFSNYNHSRIIVCKNNISSSVLKHNSELRSTKAVANHGYGHCIVSDIVRKYDGQLHYFEEGNMFGVQVVIPFPENHSDVIENHL